MRSLPLRAALLPFVAAGLVAPFLGGAATAVSDAEATSTASGSESVVVTKDTAGDIDSGVDLRRVRLGNREMIRVQLEHADLVPTPEEGYGVGASIFFDTDSTQKGPEFEFVGGLFQGTDYVLAETDGWKRGKNLEMQKCFYIMKLDYDAERTVVRIDPDCFGDPDRVRIAVRAAADTEDGSDLDWLVKRRQFTAWADAER